MSGFFSSSDVFWIAGDPAPGLAIVLRPRGGDWLEDELLRYQRGGVTTLVSLLEIEEMRELGLEAEGSSAAGFGIGFLSFPIRDRHVPQNASTFRSFVSGLATRLRAGERIGVHCRGSIGRATVTAACALIEMGWNNSFALDAVEAARGCAVPDTAEQREWILSYPSRA